MEENYTMIPGTGTKLIVRDVKQEIETAFLDYSMSVIVSRALPDVRDGLKPVHRRILYTMYERNNDPQHPYRKSADTVGAVLGSYHPHGDASVYDAMVRLAQNFSMRYPLVDGQGNFGSVDGDPAAAYRYTEARMSKIATDMLTDIEKDTIDWDPNFDETKKEPHMLPSRFPNLLCNGSQGIAVGMATNIPPHNLREVIDGCVAYIDNPEIDVPGLMEYIQGPDFPTGGVIMGRSGIRAAYMTGRGKITLRGRATIEEKKNGKSEIVITEIPYMVNKSRLIQAIAQLVKDKRVEGITDINDESSRKGMRIVIEVKKDANASVILNQLYRYSQLQDTVGAIMLALDDGVPKIMDLKTILQRYVEHQQEVVRRRSLFELKKAQERAHILEGLRRAVDIVDDVIYTIRHCGGGQAEAKLAIMEKFGFDDVQADAICKFPLGRLAGLEIQKIQNELDGLHATIAELTEILADAQRLLQVVREELLAIKEKYGDDRRTEIESVSGEMDIEDLIPEETCVYTMTEGGYIKRQSADTYQVQKRGGRGIISMGTKEEDNVAEMFVGSSHDKVLFITNFGRIFRIKGYQVPQSESRTARGGAIVNILDLQKGETVISMLRESESAGEEACVTMITRQGLIKRTAVSAYQNIRKSGMIAITFNEGDSLAWSGVTGGSDELIICTKNGRAVRFNEQKARMIGRSGKGVRAIRLGENDSVVGAGIAEEDKYLFVVTEAGKGRLTALDNYPVKNRGGKGVLNYRMARGLVAGVKIVGKEDDLILISQNGVLIRMHVSDLNPQSRAAGGVRVMRLGEGDCVTTLTRTDRDDNAEVAKIEATAEDLAEDAEDEALLAGEDAEADEAEPEETEE